MAAYVKSRLNDNQIVTMVCTDQQTLGSTVKAIAFARLFLQEFKKDVEVWGVVANRGLGMGVLPIQPLERPKGR